MRAVPLDTYRRLTLAGSLLGVALFGGGLVVLVQAMPVPLAIALMVGGIAAALASALVQVEGAPADLPPSLLLYTRPACALCDEARALLDALRAEVPFDVWEVDVDADPDLKARFGDRVPVAVAGGEELFSLQYSEARVRAAVARG